MKYIIFPLLLSACTNIGANQEVIIFDTSVKLNTNCQIEFISNNKIKNHNYSFNKNGKCKLVTHAGTNVTHIKYVKGMYVLFVENNIKKGSKCFSEYSAFGISKQNIVHVTDRIKKSGSCYQDKEIQSFEYFSALLKPLNSIR